jgi:hypothetical protein
VKKPTIGMLKRTRHLEPLKSPRPRKADPGVVFSLRLSAEELESLRDSAEREGVTVSDLIRARMFPSTDFKAIPRIAKWSVANSPRKRAHR